MHEVDSITLFTAKTMNTIVEETLFYGCIAGTIFLLLFAGLVVIMLLTIPGKGIRLYLRRIARTLLFLVFLFAYGAVANAAWVVFFNDRLYVSRDPLTYFIPFIPFGWWALDAPCGGRLLGSVTMLELRLLWLAFAAIVWAAAGLTYRALIRRKAPNQTTQADGAASAPQFVR